LHKKKWKSNKLIFSGKPNLPKFLNKKGRFIALFYETAILKPNKKNPNTIGLSSLKMRIPIQTKNKIIEIQVVPLLNGDFKINIAYDFKEKELKKDNKKYCSIDLGINNLMTVTSNKQCIKPLIVNGRPLKSMNRYYNKLKSEYQSTPTKEYKN